MQNGERQVGQGHRQLSQISGCVWSCRLANHLPMHSRHHIGRQWQLRHGDMVSVSSAQCRLSLMHATACMQPTHWSSSYTIHMHTVMWISKNYRYTICKNFSTLPHSNVILFVTSFIRLSPTCTDRALAWPAQQHNNAGGRKWPQCCCISHVIARHTDGGRDLSCRPLGPRWLAILYWNYGFCPKTCYLLLGQNGHHLQLSKPSRQAVRGHPSWIGRHDHDVDYACAIDGRFYHILVPLLDYHVWWFSVCLVLLNMKSERF